MIDHFPTNIDGMPSADYHDFDAISKHGLDLINRSPAHYRAARTFPREQSRAMFRGELLHAAVLEPDTFHERYLRDPFGASRSNDAKQEREKLNKAGWRVVPGDLWDEVHTIADSVLMHPGAKNVFASEGGVPERSLFWHDEEHEVLCKARLDWFAPITKDGKPHVILVDLKTTADVSYDAFARACHTYRYHGQAAWYIDGWQAVNGTCSVSFLFVCVETSPHHAVALYTLSERALDWGRELVRKDLATYAACKHLSTWPSIGEDQKGNFQVREIELPNWAYRESIS